MNMYFIARAISIPGEQSEKSDHQLHWKYCQTMSITGIHMQQICQPGHVMLLENSEAQSNSPLTSFGTNSHISTFSLQTSLKLVFTGLTVHQGSAHRSVDKGSKASRHDEEEEGRPHP